MAQQQNTTKIIRSVNTSKHNFTPISNQLIQNVKLSLEARGLIMYIISLPEDWIIYKGQVQNALEMNKTKFNRIWKECIQFGYIQCIKERVDKGRFNYHYVISDILSDGGETAGGKSVGGKPVSKQKTQEEKIHQEKNIQESSSSPQGSTVKLNAEILFEKYKRNEITQSQFLSYINS